MKELKAIEPVSLGKIFGVVMAVFGFFVGIAVAIGLSSTLGVPGVFGGVASIVVVPIVFGILGFIIGVIEAFVYNVVAKRFGGVMLDL
jgi:hypothetical protein